MWVWRTTLVIALTMLWSVVGLHCVLEVLPGLEFLSCCQHEEADTSPAHHEGDCDGDGCSAIESGLYQLQAPQNAPQRPVLSLVLWLTPPVDIGRARQQSTPAGAWAAPPESSHI